MNRRHAALVKLGPIGLAVIAGIAIGGALFGNQKATLASQKEDHKPTDAGVKAPLAEVMHCPLAFAGVHLLKDLPERSAVAYHFCKPLSDDVAQCMLYDSTSPNAKLIGIEYLVSDALFKTMPADEQIYWHDHEYEVDAGLIRSLTQTGADEKATLAKVRTLHGKVFHTWASGDVYPRGPARLFWSVTGKDPFTLPADAKLPPEIKLKPAH